METYYEVEVTIRLAKSDIGQIMIGILSEEVKQRLLQSMRIYCLEHFYKWKEQEFTR